MSVDEFHTWLMYRRKWGVSILRGIENGAALTAQSVRGGKFSDYLPNRSEKASDPASAATIEQAMAMLGGTKRR